MNGLRPIFGSGSRLRWQLRSACLPLLVFSTAVLAVGYCWRDIVTIVKVPSAARETQQLSCEPTNRALLSASHSCRATNEESLHHSATKATAAH